MLLAMTERHDTSLGISLLLGCLILFLYAGCSAKPTAESIAKGKTLAYAKCTACHEAAHFEKHRYSRDEWESVINRMKDHGAQFTPEEQNQISDFLSSKYGK